MENPNLKRPKYTVGILIFNRTQELVDMARDCLASVLNNCDREETQIILVDNGSTVRYDWAKDVDIYIRFDKNMGISRGWNAILRNATGDYINILGDDVIVHKGWLEKLQEAMDQPQAGVANVHVQHLPHGEGIKEHYKWFSGACFMMTQKTIDRVGYFAEEVYFPCNFEDHDYWTRVLRRGLKLYVNFTFTVQHLEGRTVHAKDLSEHFLEMKRRFMAIHKFDNQEVFCGDKPFPYIS